MATARRLSEGWTLTDGVLEPFHLSAPLTVLDALMEYGELKEVVTGMSSRAAEWIALHPWRYAAPIELPDEDEERAELRFERLAGRGWLRVNGEAVCRFEPGALRADITGWLRPEGDNRLELAFEPELPGADALPDCPLTLRGVAGGVWLNTTNYVTVVSAAFAGEVSGDQGRLQTSVRMVAHAAGRYTFRYQLSLEDEAVAGFEFYERLPAAERTVVHPLLVNGALPWTPDAPHVYQLNLSIERSGVGCERIRRDVWFEGGFVPARSVVFRGAHWSPDGDRSEALLELMRAMGAEGAWLEGSDAVSDAQLRSLGLAVLKARPNESARVPALCRGERLELLAGGERFWPPNGPLWRQRQGELLDGAHFVRALGDAALTEPHRLARASRVMQAEALRRLAEGRAVAREPLVVDEAVERYPQLCSCALVEHDGLPRPAYHALLGAWKPLHLCALVAAGYAPGERTQVEIYLLGSGEEALTASASLYSQEGTLLGGISFPALPGGVKKLGEFAVQMPEAPCLALLRLELSGGGGRLIDRTDYTLAAGPAAAPLGALLNPPRAYLKEQRREGEAILQNDSPVVAFGVCTPLYSGGFWCGYGALLPGEQISLGKTQNTVVECLNTMV